MQIRTLQIVYRLSTMLLLKRTLPAASARMIGLHTSSFQPCAWPLAFQTIRSSSSAITGVQDCTRHKNAPLSPRAPSQSAFTFTNLNVGTQIRTQQPSTSVRYFWSQLYSSQQTQAQTQAMYETDIPLVFVPGMKGSHLSFPQTDTNNPTNTNTNQTKKKKNKRVWLTLGNLINFPPKPSDYPERSLALPLTYSPSSSAANATSDEQPLVQDRGPLVADGIVNHILELGKGIEYLPFYGHVTSHLSPQPRPTSTFDYDWRRSLPELTNDLHTFILTQYPGPQPVQILAHSMGGLLTYELLKRYPEKYSPGAVVVGVPFGTGIQYLQDLHRGYFTELGRCQQFKPRDVMTLSSHWSFFPVDAEEGRGLLVDVSEEGEDVAFVKDVSAIGNPGSVFQPIAIEGADVEMDYYNVEDWERMEVGVFDPKLSDEIDEGLKEQYRHHMRVQLKAGKRWRDCITRDVSGEELPPLVCCATNTIPTVNQILRRQSTDENTPSSYEYDYISGRSVPGDGRIDYDKSYPPDCSKYPVTRLVPLDSAHAKQFCWEESGGNFGSIWDEVLEQIRTYDRTVHTEPVGVRQVTANVDVADDEAEKYPNGTNEDVIALAIPATKHQITPRKRRSPFKWRRKNQIASTNTTPAPNNQSTPETQTVTNAPLKAKGIRFRVKRGVRRFREKRLIRRNSKKYGGSTSPPASKNDEPLDADVTVPRKGTRRLRISQRYKAVRQAQRRRRQRRQQIKQQK